MVIVISSKRYSLEDIIRSFEKRWEEKFIPTSRKSQCCLFEELVFIQHMNPVNAQRIVDTIVANKRLFQ